MRRALLLIFSLLTPGVAVADICTDHGYAMGTPGYLDCWRYVNQVNQQNQARDQQLFRDLQNFGAVQQQQPPQLTTPLRGWCRTQWGALVACR